MIKRKELWNFVKEGLLNCIKVSLGNRAQLDADGHFQRTLSDRGPVAQFRGASDLFGLQRAALECFDGPSRGNRALAVLQGSCEVVLSRQTGQTTNRLTKEILILVNSGVLYLAYLSNKFCWSFDSMFVSVCEQERGFFPGHMLEHNP